MAMYQPVKIFLHAYDTEFDILSAYAKRILNRGPLPDQQMLADVKRGMKSMAWKFEKHKVETTSIDFAKFRVERLVIGKDFDGPDIELGVTLKYPDDVNQWHIKYFREGESGSFNWIPRIE